MRKILIIIIAIFLFLPLLMWAAWFFTPKKKLVLAIVDKTVLTSKGQEHISLSWILNHERYTKTSKDPYKIDHDYFGFFPGENEKFEIKGLERFSSNQLVQLSNDADLVYFTDTYGIYNNEWYTQRNVNERSGMLYGGLSDKDVELLTLMKKKQKLIITEFNTIGSPTRLQNRLQFEKLFGIKWTGWTARYFHNLDIKVNKDIPQWLINNYKKAHNQEWPFTKAGIAFVNNSDQVVILEEGKHLSNAMPYINSSSSAQDHYGLPEKMKYPFWFDIIKIDQNINEVSSTFQISANRAGEKELDRYRIPKTFPAVTKSNAQGYSFFYFSGDFSDNPIDPRTIYFKGISFFKSFFYNKRDPMERSSFFWNFYRPLVTTILEDYKIN